MPVNVEALYGLGLVYFHKGNYAEASGSFQKALSFRPEFEPALRYLGLIQYYDKHYLEAIPYLKEAFFYNPDSFENPLYLGLAYYFAGEKGKALPLLKKVTAVKNAGSFRYQLIAEEFYHHIYLPESISILEEGMVIFPNDTQIPVLLGKIYFNIGQTEKAFTLWQKALSLDPDNEEIRAYLAQIP
jgi:tetratricopeptide (TPR) repeat protein